MRSCFASWRCVMSHCVASRAAALGCAGLGWAGHEESASAHSGHAPENAVNPSVGAPARRPCRARFRERDRNARPHRSRSQHGCNRRCVERLPHVERERPSGSIGNATSANAAARPKPRGASRDNGPRTKIAEPAATTGRERGLRGRPRHGRRGGAPGTGSCVPANLFPFRRRIDGDARDVHPPVRLPAVTRACVVRTAAAI
jgi:hypothetical protein